MNYSDFEKYCRENDEASELTELLRGLFELKKGRWEKAHEVAQEQKNENGSWLHAHLHRVEGDLSNASYWYHQAKRPVSKTSLDAEWQELAQAFCKL
jgi:hypothetical protein